VSERARPRQMSGADDEFPLDPVDPRFRPVGIGDQSILTRAMPSLVPDSQVAEAALASPSVHGRLPLPQEQDEP